MHAKQRNENAVLSLKKWKNAVLSLKTAFFLFFFQKKKFERAGGCMRCEATAKLRKASQSFAKQRASNDHLKNGRRIILAVSSMVIQ